MGIKHYIQLSGLYSLLLFLTFLRFDLVSHSPIIKVLWSLVLGFLWPIYLGLLSIVLLSSFISGDFSDTRVSYYFLLLLFSKYIHNKYLQYKFQDISGDNLSEIIDDPEVINPIDQRLSEIFSSTLEVSIDKKIISKSEGEIVKKINLKPSNFMLRLRNSIKNSETRNIIILMFDAIKSWNLPDDEILRINAALSNFKQSGWDLISWINKGVWYVFKIVVYIDKESDVASITDNFDFKLPKDKLNAVTGLCLGSKNYIINDVDVTLLAYSLDKEDDIAWVRKGAFAFLEFKSPDLFKQDLETTAEKLLRKYQLIKS